jgi:hypothetical protein
MVQNSQNGPKWSQKGHKWSKKIMRSKQKPKKLEPCSKIKGHERAGCVRARVVRHQRVGDDGVEALVRRPARGLAHAVPQHLRRRGSVRQDGVIVHAAPRMCVCVCVCVCACRDTHVRYAERRPRYDERWCGEVVRCGAVVRCGGAVRCGTGPCRPAAPSQGGCDEAGWCDEALYDRIHVTTR